MRNETLKNLLLTASLISASALLTACGNNADPAKTAKPAAPILEEPSESVEVITDGIKDDGKNLKKTLAEAATATETAVSTSTIARPLYTAYNAKYVAIQNKISELQSQATAVQTSYKTKSYNEYIAAVNNYKAAHQAIAKQIDEYNKAKKVFLDSPEISILNNVSYFEKTHQQAVATANEFLTKNPETAYDKSIVDFDNAYVKMYTKSAGLLATEWYSSFANELVKAAASKLPSIAQLEGESQKLANSDYALLDLIVESLGAPDEGETTEKSFSIDSHGKLASVSDDSASSLKNLFKAGKLDAVASQFSLLLKPYITLEMPYAKGMTSISGYWKHAYTLAELKVIAEKGALLSPPDAGNESIEEIDYHPYPMFVAGATKLKDGKKPSVADIEAISAAIDSELPSAIKAFLLKNNLSQQFFKADMPTASALSAGTLSNVSGKVSLRTARAAATGLVDGRAFNMNGVAGQSIELGLPLFVELKGDVSSAKSTEAATGSVAYRLGNTVIGAIQGYANSGAGFGIDSRQLETSVVASHSFGSFFVEGQVGSVSATEVHFSNWSGLRSQVTLGLDTEFVSPFVQLTHRQLDRSGLDLNETTGYVGLDMDIAKLAADTYSVDTRLLAKAGYGSKAWSLGSKDLGSTTGFSGSVEWSASLNLNSGVSFGTNLALDTVAGSSAAVNVSLDR